jgi:hypothetical protein
MITKSPAKPVSEEKTPKREAARTLAYLLEEHMTEIGLSQRKKNQMVKKFGKRADRAIRHLAKS